MEYANRGAAVGRCSWVAERTWGELLAMGERAYRQNEYEFVKRYGGVARPYGVMVQGLWSDGEARDAQALCRRYLEWREGVHPDAEKSWRLGLARALRTLPPAAQSSVSSVLADRLGRQGYEDALLAIINYVAREGVPAQFHRQA